MRQQLPHACDHPAAHRLLALLATYRFATTTQLARLTAEAYGSLSSAIRQTLRHLARLQEHDLVTRLERRVGRACPPSPSGRSRLVGAACKQAALAVSARVACPPASWLICWRLPRPVCR